MQMTHPPGPRVAAERPHQLQAAPADAPLASHHDAEMARCVKTTQYSLLSHVLKLGPIRPVTCHRDDWMPPLTRNLPPAWSMQVG